MGTAVCLRTAVFGRFTGERVLGTTTNFFEYDIENRLSFVFQAVEARQSTGSPAREGPLLALDWTLTPAQWWCCGDRSTGIF